MSTITATPDIAKSQVRLDLDFSDIDAPYVYVTRVDPLTGASVAVRGHGSSTTISGLPYVPMQAGYKAVLYDTEMPLDSNFYYVATAPSVTMNVNSTFAGNYTDPWVESSPSGIIMRMTTNVSGQNFLTFNGDGATATPTLRAEDIAATAGATFTLTASLIISAANGVGIGMNFRDSAGTILSSPSTSIGAPLTLTSVSVLGTAPANTTSVQPYVFISGTPGSGAVLSVASIALTNVAGSATSGPVMVPSLGACWLKDPLRPSANVRVDFAFDPNPNCTPTEGVFFQSLDALTRSANAAVFNINNQDTPSVVSKTRSAAASTLTLVTRTFADKDRLNALMAPGSPLLFQVPDEYGVTDMPMSVGTTTESRVLPDHRFPIRVFSLPFSVVAPPGGFMQGTVGARWSDTCNRYASWSAINSAGLTWIQVLDGLAG